MSHRDNPFVTNNTTPQRKPRRWLPNNLQLRAAPTEPDSFFIFFYKEVALIGHESIALSDRLRHAQKCWNIDIFTVCYRFTSMIKTLPISLFSVTLLLFAITGCAQKKISTKEFEGIVTYHEIEKSPVIDVDDTVQLFYSHGNSVEVHSAKTRNFHTVKDYYFSDETLRLFLGSETDSLYQLSLSNPAEKLDSFIVKPMDKKISSKKCINVIVKVRFEEKNGSVSYTDYDMVFAHNFLKVDKEHFKNWSLGFHNRVIDTAGSLYLKIKTTHYDSTRKNILATRSYDIISVKEQPVAPEVFKIDRSKITQMK